MFCIVKFLDFQEENEAEIVPTSWLNEDQSFCFWPPAKTTFGVMSLVKNLAVPADDWKPYRVCCIQFFDTYAEARTKLYDAEMLSHFKETDAMRKLHYRPGKKRQHKELETSDIELGNLMNQSSTTIHTPLIQRITIVSSSSEQNDISDFKSSQDLRSDGHESLCCPCHKTLTNILQKIQSEISEHTEILNALLATNKDAVIKCAPKNLPVDLPTSSINDLEVLDRYLSDEASFNACVSYFTVYGGPTLTHVVKNILKHILTDELAKEHNMKGRGEKKAFESYSNMCTMIYCTTVKNARCKNATISEVMKIIQLWLQHSPDRLKLAGKI